MKQKHAIVVDKQGYKVEFVLVEFEEENDQLIEKPMYYSLQDGESLVYDDISNALSMVKAYWTGEKWEETASDEEIAEANPKPIEPEDLPPTETDLMAAELSLAIADVQTYMEMAIAELSMAIATK